MKNILSLLVFSIAIFCSQLSIAESTEGDAILGIWINEQQDGLIKIYKNSNHFDGEIVGSPNPEDANRVDINNPDRKLRSQPLQGLVILKGFVFEGNNEWKEGHIYDPNNGKTYRCNLELIDQETLSVRGYVGISLFGRTEIWTRKQ